MPGSTLQGAPEGPGPAGASCGTPGEDLPGAAASSASGAPPGALSGLTAAVLRSPDRAGATVAELAARGARAVVCPLIDFELPADTAALDDSLRRFLAGGHRWAVLTSVTTVRVLQQRCRALGLEPVMPAGTRLAVVGDATARAAADAGWRIDFLPVSDHSAEGLVAGWPEAPVPSASPPASTRKAERTVYLPQADLAAPTLEDGLRSRGWETEAVVAYRTVEALADPARRVGGVPVAGTAAESGSLFGAEVLAPADLAARLQAGRIDAVFLSSPSIARRFAVLAPTPPATAALVAIGRSTAAELHRRGLPPAATASLPTPAGLADAWEIALASRAEPAPGEAATSAQPVTPTRPTPPPPPTPPAEPTTKEPT
jgi:uroporphyrinogen-III synthase